MRLRCLFSLLLLVASAAHADTISVQGSLDSNNPNDVYLYTLHVSSLSNVVLQSYGYGGSGNAPGGVNAAGMTIAAGGFDTYFSLFTGSGSSATFLLSNDDGGCNPAAPVNGYCEDSRLASQLAAGDYTLALTLPFNFSFAENYGSGTLGDGFIGLQGDYYDSNSGKVRTSNFAFDLSTTAAGGGGTTPPGYAVTPEPSSLALLATGTGMLSTAFRRRQKHL